MARETSHMHLVNDGPRGRPAKRCVAFPIVRVWIDHHALHRRGGVVAFPARSIAAVILGNNYAASIRIKENLGGIKPHPARGIERPLDSIPVKLPRLDARHQYVPIMVGTVGREIDRDHTRGLGIISRSKNSSSTPEAFRE